MRNNEGLRRGRVEYSIINMVVFKKSKSNREARKVIRRIFAK